MLFWYHCGMAVTAADARTVDQLLSAIRDGGQPRYLMFWGHQPPPGGGAGKGCLSQWWPAAFTVDGVSYPTAEHYMMAAKARLYGDAETAGNMAKFGQHPQLRDFLAGTGSRVLVEASPRDRVWGIGLAAGDERSGIPEHWPGLNLLGFALMEVRRQLSTSRQARR